MLSVRSSKVVRGFRLRRLVRLRDLRGGPTSIGRARAFGVPAAAPYAAFGRRAVARPRRHRRRRGLWYAVIAAKRTLAELRATQDWQVRFAVPRPKAWPRWRASAASCASTRRRPPPAPRLQHPVHEGRGRHSRFQHGRGRPRRRAAGRDRVRCARARLHPWHRRPRRHRTQGARRRAGAAQGRGAHRVRTRRAPRAHRAQRRGRGGLGHRRAALRAERAVGDRQRQGQSRRDQGQPARGHRDRARLRPLRPHLSRHRHAAADADRREPDRGARLHRVPAACAALSSRSSRCRWAS